MYFLSLRFFLFFPLVVLGYFLLPRRGRSIWLLLASWFFYLCAGPACFAYLLFVLLVSYAGARGLSRCARGRRLLLAGMLVLLFGILFFLKYLNFSLSLLRRLTEALDLPLAVPGLELLLPVGISFYLFTAAGYLIDVYRGRAPEKNFIDFALFLSFFPCLLSGPIGRAGQLIPQFREAHAFDYDRFRAGLLRFLWGAFKKLVIADRLRILVNTVYAAPSDFGRLQVIAAALAFSIQIYCDFSAYSDMALGTAETMGFTLTENFRTPYFSSSVAAFWRRWHISLSNWFRDYLYIPLGGSRRSTGRTYLNVLLVFAVSGLWHGAALSFVAWGLLNGLYQVLEDVGARALHRGGRELREPGRAVVLWQTLRTFLLITVAWVFFKAGSFTHALEIFRAMAAGPWLRRPVSAWGLGRRELAVAAVAVALLFGVDLCSLKEGLRGRLLARSRPVRWLLWLGLLLSVLIFGVYGPGYDAQDFMYFGF